MMDIKEVRRQAAKLKAKLERAKMKQEVLSVKLRRLQFICEHPNARHYTYRGDTKISCPDCGYQ